jgi:hypothetical protein
MHLVFSMFAALGFLPMSQKESCRQLGLIGFVMAHIVPVSRLRSSGTKEVESTALSCFGRHIDRCASHFAIRTRTALMSHDTAGNGSPGRSSSPLPGNEIPPRPGSPRAPPSYSRSSLDRSPMRNPLILDDRPRVPPPIYLRSSSPLGKSNKGSLRINVPAW